MDTIRFLTCDENNHCHVYDLASRQLSTEARQSPVAGHSRSTIVNRPVFACITGLGVPSLDVTGNPFPADNTLLAASILA